MKFENQSPIFKYFIYFYWKGRYTERRQAKDLLSVDPLLSSHIGWNQRQKSFFQEYHADTTSQDFGPSQLLSQAISRKLDGKGSCQDQKCIHMESHLTCKSTTLTTKLSRWSHETYFRSSIYPALICILLYVYYNVFVCIYVLIILFFNFIFCCCHYYS